MDKKKKNKIYFKINKSKEKEYVLLKIRMKIITIKYDKMSNKNVKMANLRI